MARDPQTEAHLEWIGFVQPVGLVVSIPALLNAQAYINRNIAPVHQRFLASLEQDGAGEPVAKIADFRRFVCDVLEWEPTDLVEVTDANCDNLEVHLPEYQERLRPTYVVPELRPKEGQSPWQMIIQVVNDSTAFDEGAAESKHGWHASPQAKFERLLRETEIPVGLLVNGRQIRLVFAPRGESSGYLTFCVADMMSVAGRPILAAVHLLLSVDRLFLLQQETQRLPAILAESRRYQTTVSNTLAEQVLAALFELLRGFQAANDQSNGKLLAHVLGEDPNKVYEGLLTILMRLVFILYAEDRDLLSNSSIYLEFYSVSRLFERLREDAGRYPDTMDHRYGAWAQLLTLFRLLFEGGGHSDFHIPERKGHLFDPAVYPFLEGFSREEGHDRLIPQVSDGVIFRVLSNLLILDGERLSYRSLDVEQIGSVYEAIMGFSLEVAQGVSIAIRAKKQHGAPTTINLQDLLATDPKERNARLAKLCEQELSGTSAEALKNADNVDDLLSILEKRIAKKVTPYPVPKGNMVLQPSSERRKSGSHYTPRSLTEPIVRKSLKPLLDGLGDRPKPEQILEIKVCDPAMGSGAFLVEACRQLGDALVRAWNVHGSVPNIPPDEDELLYARRLIAQRCVYGVDRNPMAVNLAKLSLWLATLAKDHAFTFLDHTLRHGDSLVGLSTDQITRFHWAPSAQRMIDGKRIKRLVVGATKFRKEILESSEGILYPFLEVKLLDADRLLQPIRLIGNSVISCFFSANKDRLRNQARLELLPKVSTLLDESKVASTAAVDIALLTNIHPFHWEIEFPEVFDRNNPGFDLIVGNPPFSGHVGITESNVSGYSDYLRAVFSETGGKCDLVGFFFRRAFELLRNGGTFGLIATKTIRQGDTRESGLRWICQHGGTIYSAQRRLRWPGQAAVIVSVVHVTKGDMPPPFLLDGRKVNLITAFLFHRDGHDSPSTLLKSQGKSFQGSVIRGVGFTFDDTKSPDTVTPLSEMRRLIEKNPRNAELIFPYLGGKEVNESPTHNYHRYVINFGEMDEDAVAQWPDLLDIVRKKVLQKRSNSEAKTSSGRVLERYWQFGHLAKELYDAIQNLDRVLVIARVSPKFGWTFLPSNYIYSEQLIVVSSDSWSDFAVLQSRVHEEWVRFFASSFKDDRRYTSSDCFETFPFPESGDRSLLSEVGQQYFEFRAQIMVSRGEGLTKLYNAFHDQLEQSADIQELRRLHGVMDDAVLGAYGIRIENVSCDFLPDYESDDESEPATSYRWLDDVREEILLQLLEINRLRAAEERIGGVSNQTSKKKGTKSPKKEKSNVRRKADDSETSKQKNTIESTEQQLTFADLEK